jgi:acyl carrier protein
MKVEQFFERVAEALDSGAQLSRGQSLESVEGWDSLGILSILDLLESEGVKVDLDELRAAQTTDDLLRLAASLLEDA